MGSHSRAGKVLLWLHPSRKVTLITSFTHFLFAKKKINNKKKNDFFSQYEMVSYPKKSNWNLKGTRILYFFFIWPMAALTMCFSIKIILHLFDNFFLGRFENITWPMADLKFYWIRLLFYLTNDFFFFWETYLTNDWLFFKFHSILLIFY